MNSEKKTKIINTQNNHVQKFGKKSIRTVWDTRAKKWWFCVMDVISSVTDNKDPKDYLKKMRSRDKELGEKWVQIVRLFPFQTAGGIQRINFADPKGITRIIKTVTNPKAEKFRQWIAEL